MPENDDNNVDQKPNLISRLRLLRAQEELKLRQTEAARQHAEALMRLVREGHVKITKVEDIEAALAGPGDVEEIRSRHHDLIISPQVVTAAREVRAGNQAPFKALKREIGAHGGFLQVKGYSLDDVAARLGCSRQWVVAHARGSIADPNTTHMRESVWAADIQIKLPEDTPGAELTAYVPSLSNTSAFYDQHRDQAIAIATEILLNRGTAACISDVGVSPYQPVRESGAPRYASAEYQHKGFASAARRFAVDHIRSTVNAMRANKIKYLLAEMFSIQAVTLEDGEKVLLPEILRNEPSIIAHVLSTQFRALLAWRGPVTDVSVEGGATIHTGWDTAVLVMPD